jgi:OTU domain-containing protein 4
LFLQRRNIILFEPFNKGKWFLRNEKYNAAPCLNVFYLCEGNRRRSPDHFDSVFERDYVEVAAMCQSLIYEILYTKVYKLPDIMLAVELMLHDPGSLHYISMPPKRDGDRIVEKAISDDGREFVLDTADKTNCVLDDDSLCHFHNKHNFTEIVRYEAAGSFGAYEPKYDYYERMRPRYSSMLPDFNKSCVRQLLEQNITPFPFKVAKTLDPFMYRNIEFDVWNDVRRAQRNRNWYYAMNLRVSVYSLINLKKNEKTNRKWAILRQNTEFTAKSSPSIKSEKTLTNMVDF